MEIGVIVGVTRFYTHHIIPGCCRNLTHLQSPFGSFQRYNNTSSQHIEKTYLKISLAKSW